MASFVTAGAGVMALVASQLATTTAVADAPPTEPGSAFASAVVLDVNPQFGGLSLIVRGGQSTASYTGSQSVANSQAVNLGYVGGLLGGPNNCFSSKGPSSTASLDALQASSVTGASSASADNGIEAVTVNPSPESAGATTSLAPISVPGLLSVSAQSATHVSYAPGQDQEADAATTMNISLLGGVVTLNGLRWTANQESGSTSAATAAFTMTSVTVAGKTTSVASPAQVASAFAVVNKVLATFGLSLSQPAQSTDPVTGTVTIGPLKLRVVGTAITNTVLGALNPTETALEEQIGKALVSGGNACIAFFESSVGDAELVAGIVEGILAGGGFVDLDLGGANADTQAAPDFFNPLGATSSSDSLGQALPTLGAQTGGSGGSFGLGSGGLPTSSLGTGPPTTSTVPGHQSAAAAPSAVLVHCVTSSPSGHPGCWSGAATVGAAALLVVGGALFAADIVRSRRRLIRPKETL